MKKLFYLGLCALLTTGVGCALSNYELITDNDQVSNGQGSGVVNTNGKALVRQSSQVALGWPDGTDNAVWFVDQAANGDRTLSTYNNFSTGSDPIFPDDLYCSPERQGCAIVTSSDPEVGDVDIYDYSYNPNCAGARSVYYLTSTTRYYGECGRALALTDRLSLLNQGRLVSKNGVAGLQWAATPMNTTVTLNNKAGVQQLLPMAGSFSITMIPNGQRQTIIDLNNPMNKVLFNSAADFMSNYGSSVNEISFVYNGIEIKRSFGRTEDSNSLRNLSNRKF